MVIAGIDPDPNKKGAVTEWTKAYWEAVHPFDLSGAYPNFMMDDEGDARLKATYSDNCALLAVKKKYDPASLFRVNQNIKPAAKLLPVIASAPQCITCANANLARLAADRPR